MFGRKKKQSDVPIAADGEAPVRSGSERTLTNEFAPSKDQIKRATRTRFIWTLISSFFLLLSVIFIILVEVGDTDSKSSIRNKIYFIKINLANVIPVSVPDAQLINSIAQTIGLHDFYTVGLWGYCEGYNGPGVTSCTKPETLYWFNPVAIISNSLVAGATIALPAELNNILDLIETASHWMFGLFLTAAPLNFILMFLQPVVVYSRWWSFPIVILTFLGGLITVAAAVVATVMFVIMRDVFTSATQLNIGASIGVEMFAFMWVAAGSTIISFLIQLCLSCCCASRRDIRRGKKRGSKKAWNTETPGVSDGVTEKPSRRRGLPTFKRTPKEEA